MPVLLLLGLLMLLDCCQSILPMAGIQNGAGNLFRDVLSPLALAAFLALLLLVVRSMVLGRCQHSR